MGNARDNLGAKSVNIVLDVGPEWLKAAIEHDGRSFDPAEALSQDESEDVFGLRILQERVELVGGSFQVASAEDELSRFVIALPVS
jgi:signal transduction histidine kinase